MNEIIPTNNSLKLFAGNANPSLANRVAAELNTSLGNLKASKFADGEIRIEIQESARGSDVFILQPTCAPANDNLMELMILLDAFRRASAKRITVVMPYYGYARQDKKVKPREPITARLVADMIEMCGADRVVTLDLHADQIQGFFNIPVDHLYGGPILGEYFVQKGLSNQEDVCVVAPDVGGVGRAKKLADMLKCPFIVIAKRRPAPNVTEVVEIVGDFKGKRCVMIDDMIDTGGTIVAAAKALKDNGAKRVIVAATHAVLSDPAVERLSDASVDAVVVTNTLPITPDKEFDKLTVLSIAPLIAKAITAVFGDDSVTSLFPGQS